MLLTSITFAAAACAAQADESPLLGKPLPALEISHPLQGLPWSPEDFAGQVLVLDFFQYG